MLSQARAYHRLMGAAGFLPGSGNRLNEKVHASVRRTAHPRLASGANNVRLSAYGYNQIVSSGVREKK